MLHSWFANTWAFALLAVLPVWGVVALWAARRRRKALVRFGALPAVRTLASSRGAWRIVRQGCLLAGLLLLIAGIAGPRWGWDWEQAAAPGRDIVVVLDLSRSMLAQDVLPNRVERAKKALVDLSHEIEKRGGHRVALVAFAAHARIVCPLTHDYQHFRTALADLDALHLHPDLRPTGKDAVSGTRIGAGIRAAVEAHDPRFRGAQDIILISDGDDPAGDADQEMREGIAAARGIRVPGGRKIPVHTVGIGDPRKTSTIPLKGDEVLRFNHEVVKTRLKELPLETIARLTGGAYIAARTSTLPLAELFREHIDSADRHENDEENLPVRRLRYAWYFTGAFSFLGFEMILGQKRQKKSAKRAHRAAA
jgi:Ca-activated chloride channel homolog